MNIRSIVGLAIALLYFYVKFIFSKKRKRCYIGINETTKEMATLFPKAWSDRKIALKIIEARSCPLENSPNKILGITAEGIVIQMYLRNNLIIHAFPPKIYNTR